MGLTKGFWPGDRGVKRETRSRCTSVSPISSMAAVVCHGSYICPDFLMEETNSLTHLLTYPVGIRDGSGYTLSPKERTQGLVRDSRASVPDLE